MSITNNLEKFLETVHSGKLAIGAVITFSDPAVTELAAENGMDFLWIDGEHGDMDRNSAITHMMAVKGTNCASFYRVPACNHTEIKRIIDYAPAGIIIPMIMNEEDARYAVSACRYPLAGDRGCGFRRGNRYGAEPLDLYWKRSTQEPLVILQIEHIEAYRNLDKILAVPGVGAIIIGPYDLTASMGKPGQWKDPEVSQVLDSICQRTLAAGKLLGAYSECNFDLWKKRGIQFIATANDTNAMALGLKMMCLQVKENWNK